MANRRFIPFYFDLSNRGVAGDPDAREFVVAVKPALGGRGVPTPPVLFMNAAGKVLAEVSNYASPAQVLEAMRKALASDAGKYAAWTDAEKALAGPVEIAQLHMDLLEDEKAMKVLAKVKGERAAYLRGRLRRYAGDWSAMKAELAQVKSENLLDDVRMEQAHELWQAKKFKALAAHLKGFSKASNRYTEARYHEGLALYHQGKKDEALALWSETITGCPQDPWIYRADWAYTQLKKKSGGGFFSSAGPRDSLLNRIGYMGRGNPDLKGP